MLKKTLVAGTIGILAITTTYFAAPAFAQSTVPPPRIEKHPILRKSINQLNRIEGELAKADNDFQGHKEKARDLIRQAIEQLKIAIQSDKH